MAVPKERQLLLQWPRPFDHALQPPAAQLKQMLLLGLPLLTLHFAALFFRLLPLFVARALKPLVHFPKREELFHSVRVRPGPVRIGRRVGNLVVIDQVGNGLVRPPLREFLDFVRRAAEASPIEQVGRRSEVPFLGRQWFQHTHNWTGPATRWLQKTF